MARRDNTLKYFMWGYQPHFQGAAESLAENLFKGLDPRFAPRLFLLGFLRQPDATSFDVCIEPEEFPYDLAAFSDVRTLASELVGEDPRSSIFQTLPQAQEDQDAFVVRRSLQRTVKRTVDSLSGGEFASYCSLPAVVGKYDVVVVLQLQADIYDSHYRLQKESLSWDERSVARSYLEATAFSFLNACGEELLLPEPGRSMGAFHRQYGDVPREASRLFALRVAHATERFGMAGDLFDTFNAVSAMFYEKAAGRGSLILASRGHPNIRADVTLAEAVRLSSHRAVRKLVEVSSRGTSLLCDGEYVYGLGGTAPDYDPSREDLFEIAFNDHYAWSVAHDGNVMMRVAHNLPLPLLPRLDRVKLASDLGRLFGLVGDGASRLMDLVQEATELGHGAQIVISSSAAEEAARLSPQATTIKPVILTPEFLRKFCAVDGAVLLEPEGRCHAFGVILDGRVSARGDRSRGSRFNSAVRYADGRKDCLIVVVSDDETIDFVPDLRPQMSRAAIAQALGELERIVKEGLEEEAVYNKAMGWLRDRRFYLSAEQCERVNAARRTVEGRRVSEMGRLYITYGDLVPDDEMDDFYLID